jgi:ribonuclease HI
MLQGSRCYVDASTPPDQQSILRQAGLGVFFVNTEAHLTQTIYIKVKLDACSSVLMAEAAALALAVQVALHMNLTSINFLSDNEQLVKFLNSSDHFHPPDWRIKHFTQMFSN